MRIRAQEERSELPRSPVDMDIINFPIKWAFLKGFLQTPINY
jgi:hypothetical protein